MKRIISTFLTIILLLMGYQSLAYGVSLDIQDEYQKPLYLLTPPIPEEITKYAKSVYTSFRKDLLS